MATCPEARTNANPFGLPLRTLERRGTSHRYNTTTAQQTANERNRRGCFAPDSNGEQPATNFPRPAELASAAHRRLHWSRGRTNAPRRIARVLPRGPSAAPRRRTDRDTSRRPRARAGRLATKVPLQRARPAPRRTTPDAELAPSFRFPHMQARTKRPANPRSFQLTTRDNAMLCSLQRYRYLCALQLRTLHFQHSSIRAVQARLRCLWEGRYVDRLLLPAEVPGVRDRWAGVPVYSLARRGAAAAASALGLPIQGIPHTPLQNRTGFAALRHALVAADFAVAATALCAASGSWQLQWIAERTMRRQLAGLGQRTDGAAMVPDGAVALTHPSLTLPQTYLLEVVRAGAKGGNQSLVARCTSYLSRIRAGFFRRVYGIAWVYGVVFLLPTERRAAELRRRLAGLPGAERLLRIAHCEEPRGADKAPALVLTPERLQLGLLLSPSGVAHPLLPKIPRSNQPTHV